MGSKQQKSKASRTSKIPNPEESRIVIVGAGPAGLSAAYYLKKHGFKHVVVLERLGRVGGLCRTITEDGFSFDLGANYITPAYDRVRAIAKEHDAKMSAETDGGVLRYQPDTNTYEHRGIWDAVRGADTWRYLKACWRYFRERRKIRHIVDAPGFARIEEHEELCVPFHQWLHERDLDALIPLFEIPITVMGYGYIKCPDCVSVSDKASREISAPYALKYMTLRTFVPMVVKFLPRMNRYWWPKRFEDGYQRLWERVATRLDVRLNIDIERIERSDKKVYVTFRQIEQSLNSTRQSCAVQMPFDYLILTCPLSLDVLGRQTGENQTMLDLSDEESALFGKILTYSYALAACSIKPESWPDGWKRILCTLPPTQEGWPWAITRQTEDSEMTQFYMRLPEGPSNHKDKRERCGCAGEPTEAGGPFVQGMRRHAGDLPAGLAAFIEQTKMEVMENEWFTYDHWPYFQHVPVSEMKKNRFYTRLEALQGHRNTYYGGSLLNFELVENVMEYSEHLVLEYFVKPQAEPQVAAARPRTAPGADADAARA